MVYNNNVINKGEKDMIGYVIGSFLIGVFFGVFLIALVSAGRDDRP